MTEIMRRDLRVHLKESIHCKCVRETYLIRQI